MAEVEQPAAPEEVAPQAPPKTQDTAPLAAPTPAGAPLEKGLDAEPVAQRLAADIPEVLDQDECDKPAIAVIG